MNLMLNLKKIKFNFKKTSILIFLGNLALNSMLIIEILILCDKSFLLLFCY